MEEGAPRATPKRILLGTDLSARGDRALDRATQLATAWNAELLVVHAVEGEGHVPNDLQGLPSWRRGPDGLGLIERQIREDIRGPCPGLRVQVEEGPAVQVILDAIRREGCDFVVLGQGRRRPLGGVGFPIMPWTPIIAPATSSSARKRRSSTQPGSWMLRARSRRKPN